MPVVANPATADDESDENVSLDLHVSDNEDEEKQKVSEIPMETEDEILNRFEDASKVLEKMNSANNGMAKENETESIISGKNDLDEKKVDETTNIPECNGEDKTGTSATSEKRDAVVKEINEEKQKVKENGKDEGENEDLLQVMQETTTEVDETNEETSNSDEVDEESGENNEAAEETETIQTEETTAPTEDNVASENKEDLNEEEDAMELEEPPDHIDIIEENVTGGMEEEAKEKCDVILLDDDVSTNQKPVDDDNKENDTTAASAQDNRSVLESILTNSSSMVQKEGSKPNKRLLEETENDSSKRPKLDSVPKEIKKIEKLTNFKRFMLDKKMTGLTRDQLEELCIQKMCECIVQRSEIGELKMKIKVHEQVLDSLRKEAVLLGKQTRDLNIVHQKVIQDVSKMQENRDKPLILPKITRSVGLQAYVKEETRKAKKVPVSTAAIISRSPKYNALTPIASKSSNTRNIAQKAVSATPTTRSTSNSKNVIQTPPNSSSSQTNDKCVIDLTDEDDKTKNSLPSVQNGTTKVNMINTPTGHKFVVMANGQPMMVKLGTMKPTPTLVMAQPHLRTLPNGTNNVGNNNKVLRAASVRGASSIGNNTGKRLTAPVQGNLRSRNSYPQSNQRYIRHPAPLPTGPDQTTGFSSKTIPPKPQLMLNKTPCGTGIVLSWKMPYKLDMYEEIASYQLYAYQETKSEPKTDSWGKIGDVKALELPMAVTLTQFAVGNRYYFAVRAVDVLTRYGPFSDYQTILL